MNERWRIRIYYVSKNVDYFDVTKESGLTSHFDTPAKLVLEYAKKMVQPGESIYFSSDLGGLILPYDDKNATKIIFINADNVETLEVDKVYDPNQ